MSSVVLTGSGFRISADCKVCINCVYPLRSESDLNRPEHVRCFPTVYEFWRKSIRVVHDIKISSYPMIPPPPCLTVFIPVSLLHNFLLKTMAEKRGRKIHDCPGKAKSQVWKHFGFYAVEGDGPLKLDKDYTICKICETAIKFTGGTTNQQNHIDKKHGTFAAPKSGLNMLKQSTLTEMRDAQTTLSFHSYKAMEVTKAIGEHLVLDMRPLSVVESPSFRNILAKAEPRYDVPSRTYYKDTFIPKLYETTKSAIISELCDAIGGVSITTDCWTSSATQSIMTVTAHFVTKTHKLKSYVLQTREVSERHTAENLATELQKCADEWGLERPPVVSDNAANILKAVRLLGWRSIPCLAQLSCIIRTSCSSGVTHSSKIERPCKLFQALCLWYNCVAQEAGTAPNSCAISNKRRGHSLEFDL